MKYYAVRTHFLILYFNYLMFCLFLYVSRMFQPCCWRFTEKVTVVSFCFMPRDDWIPCISCDILMCRRFKQNTNSYRWQIHTSFINLYDTFALNINSSLSNVNILFSEFCTWNRFIWCFLYQLIFFCASCVTPARWFHITNDSRTMHDTFLFIQEMFWSVDNRTRSTQFG